MLLGFVLATVAESYQFGIWRQANQASRALYLTTGEQPSICLRSPNLQVAWYMVGSFFSGWWLR
ncbi:hypothetical protein F4810DRAFT_658429 [Camillea tinctor]|nr:hypothetical protein F4810DRAFT_658429 [Camillea tinctor]